MLTTSRLKLSIVLSVFVYSLVQCALWVAMMSPSAAIAWPYGWYFVAVAALHAVMGAFLWWRAGDFRHTKTREPYKRVNLACHVTLFRLSAAPTILFLAVAVSRSDTSAVFLVALVAVAFFSDFLDGQTARRLNETTDIGAYLDSSTDYAVLMVLSIAFVIMSVTPLWYFLLLMGRLVGFALMMAILTRVQGEVSAETTFLGKAAIFSAMFTYAFELARYAGIPGVGNESVVLVIEILSAIILVVSLVDKAFYLVRKFRAIQK